MNYHSDCPHCKRRETAYTLHLSRRLVTAFLTFADARIRLGRPVSKGELNLTPQQYGNFQNLRHFALIQQQERAGPWEFTVLGLRFLRGEVEIPSPVAHMGGRTLAPDDLAWATHEGKRGYKTIRDVMPEDWKTRPEYQEEKRDRVA